MCCPWNCFVKLTDSRAWGTSYRLKIFLVLATWINFSLPLGWGSIDMNKVHAPDEHHGFLRANLLCWIHTVGVLTSSEPREQPSLHSEGIGWKHLHPFAFNERITRLKRVEPRISLPSDIFFIFSRWLVSEISEKCSFRSLLVVKRNVCRWSINPGDLFRLEVGEVGVDSSSVHKVDPIEMNLA